MNILCAIDGSRHSRWALDTIRQLRASKDSRLLLLHVLDVDKFRPAKGVDAAGRAALAQALDLAEIAGADMLEQAKSVAGSGWSTVQTKIGRGHPAAAIAQTAARWGADLIVIGSRGLTEFRPFLMGSISRRVVTHAPCPVLVIKKRKSVFRNFVLAVDGSKEAHRAVEFLLGWPLPDSLHASVVSVIPPLPIETGPLSRDLPAILEQVRAPLEREAHRIVSGIADLVGARIHDVTTAVAHGHPSQEIVQAVRSVKADVVVLGSRGLTDADRFAMGSVSDSVVKYAPCSVLVVRRGPPTTNRSNA